jgi:hypothetical protein
MMSADEFFTYLAPIHNPVILLEGTRALTAEDHPKLVAFAKYLAQQLPHTIFRTGNAKGADQAFAEGVSAVDGARLQYILPRKSMGKRRWTPGAFHVSIQEVTPAEEEHIAKQTWAATPEYEGLITRRRSSEALGAKALYLLRDTLKVVGSEELGLAPATMGIFYVNPANPLKGGTGHTMRVCHLRGVPVNTQAEWMSWGDCDGRPPSY